MEFEAYPTILFGGDEFICSQNEFGTLEFIHTLSGVVQMLKVLLGN